MRISLSKLGPGLLYAGAAVGVSHLVQSTRAGASYGLLMVLVVVFANVLKYPFFKAGPLYAAQTGNSLLEAFHDKGKWAMGLFYVLTIGTMFSVQAAVTLITASVVSSIFGLSFPLWQVSGFLLIICFLVLSFGRYQWLSNIMKVVIILLSLTTLVTLFAAFAKPPDLVAERLEFSLFNQLDILFLIALIGWMPAPLDISLWHSEWTLAESGSLNVQKSLFDFKLGYWGTTFLAVAFVALGSIMLRGSGEELSSSGAVFSGQVIGMYTQTLGNWSFIFVALAAFTTMFSTTLTVLDAFPRILSKALKLSCSKAGLKNTYTWILILLISGALVVLVFFMENMKQLVDLATSISFLSAPLLAVLIAWVVFEKKAVYAHFSKLNRMLAVLGILFLIAFGAYYLWLKLS